MHQPERTEFAIKAVALADIFRSRLGAVRLVGAETYRLELATPDGISTGHGQQALQHIKLIAENFGPTIIAGSANQVEKVAELRSFEHLEFLHSQRFPGVPLPFERAAYDRLMNQVEGFFTAQRMRVVRSNPPITAASASSPRRGARSERPAWMAPVIALLFAAFVFAVLRRLLH